MMMTTSRKMIPTPLTILLSTVILVVIVFAAAVKDGEKVAPTELDQRTAAFFRGFETGRRMGNTDIRNQASEYGYGEWHTNQAGTVKFFWAHEVYDARTAGQELDFSEDTPTGQ